MKEGHALIIIGIIMTTIGSLCFYSVQDTPSVTDLLLRVLKYGGTFFGMMGIGVTIAGILLYLINRPQPKTNAAEF